MTTKALLNDWLAFLAEARTRTLQQFGQTDDESTFNGATGCTHTVLQILIYAKTGRIYSHDEISQVAGYPWPSQNPGRRGMRASTAPTSELMRVVRSFGLPYKPVFYNSDLTPAIWAWLNRVTNANGPALVGIKYDWHPDKRGTVYNGIKADGKPNGFAEIGGATQLYGFAGPHAELRVGYDRSSDGKYHDWWRDPNHGSPARPERPAYDRLSTAQSRKLIQSYRRVLIGGDPRSLMFIVPTTTFEPR